ncbi:MAG: hypothetical protein D4R73_03605 [Deltaproteobacteria bacterium]|nr:MAG: hypothetical protein D4R73_03605 [Deltaproteobacteria bacterium]
MSGFLVGIRKWTLANPFLPESESIAGMRTRGGSQLDNHEGFRLDQPMSEARAAEAAEAPGFRAG